jgi:peptidyl-prolyl cis-trans isomerase D
MIRFLQRDSRVVKAFFVVIIGMASVSMVVYLIPGLTGQSATSADTYAVIYPHWYSRFLSSGATVSQEKVDKMARAQLQQQRYPDNPMILGLFEQRVGKQLIQQQILLEEANQMFANTCRPAPLDRCFFRTASSSETTNTLHWWPTASICRCRNLKRT